MANANGSTHAHAINLRTNPRTTASELTPAEQRILRIYRGIPDDGKPAFAETLEVVCHACGWGDALTPPLHAVGSKAVESAPLPVVPMRVDEIKLFGSRKLIRGRDGRSWRLVTEFGPPRFLSDDVSMIVNATLRAARADYDETR